MRLQLWIATMIVTAAPLWATATAQGQAAKPEGTLTVAVATFGNERWSPLLPA